MSRHMMNIAAATAIVMIAASPSAKCAVPPSINYQGVLTDGGGDPITVATSVTFTIYDNATLGAVLWAETRSVSPDAEGRFTVLLGQAVPIGDTVFKTPPCWLGTKVASDPEATPRLLLSSVPWSQRVSTLDGATGGDVIGEVTILTDGTGGGAGVRDPGGNVSSLSSTAAVFVDSIGSRSASYGIDGIEITADNGVAKVMAPEVIFSVNSGDSTLSFGNGLSVGGACAVAFGSNNNVEGRNSISVGNNNSVEGDCDFTSIVGGRNQRIDATHAFIGGGLANEIEGDYAAILGGDGNFISTTDGGASYGAIGGGQFNLVGPVQYGFIGGGSGNVVDTGDYASVLGGLTNRAVGSNSAVVCGNLNRAAGSSAAVLGGFQNNADGSFAVVISGRNSTAGNNSLAAGTRARAIHTGSWVWGDNTDDDITSTADGQFTARASGGVRFYSSSNLSTGVTLAPGGGSWAAVSDRNVKENIKPVDGEDILAKLSEIPIADWNYIEQDDSIRHIGPMAQDFYAAFGVGEDDRHITTIDADGVALAAIKALYEKQKVENQELRAQIAELRELISAQSSQPK